MNDKPEFLNNILKIDLADDQFTGFTAVTKLNGKTGPTRYAFNRLSHDEQQAILENNRFEDLWRPNKVIAPYTLAGMIAYTTHSFYQNNDDVTLAFYFVQGYYYLVACWFDNKTGKRIA